MPLDERLIFDAARRIEGLPARLAYVEQACEHDGELLRRVQALLRVHEEEQGFLQSPAVPDLALGEGPGTRIGPYKLLEQIGEGGFGVVFMAEQQHPLRRVVALKVLKPGMDSRQIVARFEAERQAMALMDHPNIAKVLDSGETSSGRPFFVMELVKGIPITRYCDEHRLAPRERLSLFATVCQAVQHAHHKGVIHRDIKPTNVLVAAYEGRPVPKVIDFGVAKALGQKLTERTLVTAFGGIIGTLEYMSPEQAEFNALDVDTRADIYSLGVLLYELLTGTTPLPRERVKQAAITEVLRLIREEDPPRPSTRLSESKESLATVSAQRKLEPARLARELRGELDWIVMKALEKDRSRRYATANGFAHDIQRYLADETVEACPPSAAYKLRKFARKNRSVLATVGAFVLLLTVAALASTWQAFRARSAEEKMRVALNDSRDAKTEMGKALEESVEARQQAEAVSNYLIKVFRTPDPRQDGWNVRVADVLERAPAELEASFASAPKTKAELLHTLGSTYEGLRLFRKAVEIYEKAYELRQATLGPNHVDTLRTAQALARAYRGAGQPEEAIALAEKTLAILKTQLGADQRDTLATAAVLGDSYRTANRYAEAIQLLEPSLKLCKSKLGMGSEVTLKTMNDLAVAYKNGGQVPDAVSLLEETVSAMTAKLGSEDPETLNALNNLGDAYRMNEQHHEAISLLESSSKLCQDRLGPENLTTLSTMNNLGLAYRDAERLPEAVTLLKKTLAQMAAKLGPDDRETLNTANNLAEAYLTSGQPTLAIQIIEQSLPRCSTKLGPENSVTVAALYDLALAYGNANEPAKAEPLLIEFVALMRQKHGGDIELAGALAWLGLIHLLQEKYTEAEADLRECLAIREKKQPDSWSTSGARSLLGGALLGRKKCAEAEPLLQAGYEGMKRREAQIPPRVRRQRLTESLERLVRLYETTGKTDQADEWRKKLEQAKAPVKPTAKP
jgi:serine/threonine protein kinase/tetratricopeptide (TPR) repeat protein